MQKIDKFTCSNCRFWKKNAHTDFVSVEKQIYKGECHCNPPQRVGHISTYPETSEEDWCGRHETGSYGQEGNKQ